MKIGGGSLPSLIWTKGVNWDIIVWFNSLSYGASEYLVAATTLYFRTLHLGTEELSPLIFWRRLIMVARCVPSLTGYFSHTRHIRSGYARS